MTKKLKRKDQATTKTSSNKRDSPKGWRPDYINMLGKDRQNKPLTEADLSLLELHGFL